MAQSDIQRSIGRSTGAGRRVARSTSPYGNQARAMRSARSFMNNAPTARMSTVGRRKSLGGSGG